MARIVCIGSMNMDVVAYTATLPKPGETVLGSSLLSSPGGKGLNQAVAARRLGGEVAFAGVLGRDGAGDALAAYLHAEGVDTKSVAIADGTSTGTAIILVDDTSQNVIVVVPGANMVWPAGALDDLRFAAGEIAVAQFEIPDAVIETAFTRARAAGGRTILNAAPARAMPAGMLDLVDVLVVNETELGVICNRDLDSADVDAVTTAACGLSTSSRAIVVTLGSAGAVIAVGGTASRVSAVPVKAIDTAGAGDCFIGGLAAALARGETLDAAVAFANRAASISVTRKGTAISMPFAHEL